MAKELSIEPPALRFTHSQEDELHKTLGELDKHSVFHTIGSAQDVTFDADGCVGPDGFRLTRWALFQLCQVVCPGLYGLVAELSGVHRELEQAREDFSFEESLDILNRIIRRRFDTRLCGKLFLKNLEAKTIDGVLGARYQWLSNLELFSRTRLLMDRLEPPHPFLEASLYGRWLMLRYVSPTVLFRFHNLGDGPGEEERV